MSEKLGRSVCTLVFIINEPKRQVLLGYKKRGWGAGLYNGFGGKVKAGEDILKAAQREIYEECGLQIHTSDLHLKGQLDFVMPDVIVESHIYTCTTFEGALQESEEMSPAWFDFRQLPYDRMWEDNKYWMKSFILDAPGSHNLNGKYFQGVVKFSDADSCAGSGKRLDSVELFQSSRVSQNHLRNGKMSAAADKDFIPILSVKL